MNRRTLTIIFAVALLLLLGPLATASAAQDAVPPPDAPICPGPTTITSAIDSSDPAQANRMYRDGIASACTAPKACPGPFAANTYYEVFQFENNTATTQCVTVDMDAGSCTGTNFIFSTAYSGAYDPNNICNNYIADIGGSPNPTGSYSFNVAAGLVFNIVNTTVYAGGTCPSYTFTVTADACPAEAPTIVVDPMSYALTVPLGYSSPVVQTMTISNTGTANLNWQIAEAPGMLSQPGPSAPESRVAPAQVGAQAPRYTPDPDVILISEGFESAVMPPTGWTQVINNPSWTWKIATIGTPHSGTYFADVEYDPALVPQNEWLLSPELNLTAGTLSFWSMGSLYWCRDTYNNCDLDIYLVVGAVGGGDDIYVGQADASWPASWTWAQSTFNLTPLLPAGPVRIGFNYVGVDGAQIGLDDILLDGTEVAGPCDTPGDIPWLSTSPVSGTVAPGASTPVNVTFDNMAAMPVGVYTGTLCVNSNDPINPQLALPVTLTIRAPTAVTITSLTSSAMGGLWLLILVPPAAVVLALLLRRRR